MIKREAVVGLATNLISAVDEGRTVYGNLGKVNKNG